MNTLAGGGSLLTVPLLVLLGLPGTVANGSNRVGVLLMSAAAAWRFRAQGVSGSRDALGVLLPVGLGSLLGAVVISRVADETFELVFGGVMLALLLPTLWPPGKAEGRAASPQGRRPRSEPQASGVHESLRAESTKAGERSPVAAQPWPRPLSTALYFAVGAYGGAFQAGVGLLLVFALSRAGHDLVRANAIKVVVGGVLTLVALPVFVLAGQVAWLPALGLALGFVAGGELGARLAVRGGERLIRPVLGAAVLVLAARMLGLWS